MLSLVDNGRVLTAGAVCPSVIAELLQAPGCRRTVLIFPLLNLIQAVQDGSAFLFLSHMMKVMMPTAIKEVREEMAIIVSAISAFTLPSLAAAVTVAVVVEEVPEVATVAAVATFETGVIGCMWQQRLAVWYYVPFAFPPEGSLTI